MRRLFGMFFLVLFDWKAAEAFSGFSHLTRREDQKQKPDVETDFRILRDKDAVYIGIRCQEPLMDKLKDAPLPRDSSFYERDSVEIFIDVEGKGVNYYQFAVTVSNSQFDSYWIEGGNTTGGYYSSIWESAVYKGKDFYTIEVKIPFSCFFKTPSENFSDTWGFNVTRERLAKPELLTWSALGRGFHEPKSFNRAAGMPVKGSLYDIELEGADAFITDKSGDRYKGNLEVSLVATGSEGERLISVYEEDRLIGNKKVVLKGGKNSIRLEDLNFERLGKKLLRVVVSEGDRVLLGALTETTLEREILKVEIEEPFYANCIFPGQEVRYIEGVVRVNLPDDKIKRSRLLVKLEGEGVNEKKEMVPVKENRFRFRASGLKVGSYRLNAELSGKGVETVGKEVVIRNLEKPEKGNWVYIDKDLNLVVNGKPIFVRGWYGGTGWMVSQELKDRYGDKPNSRHVNVWECGIGIEAERLHQVGADEMKAMGISKEELNNVAKEERNRIKQDVEPHLMVYKMMEERIKKNRDNPKAYWYYLADEPECRGVSPVYLRYQYEFIKKMDPYHPVMIISRDPSKYTGCADVLNPHPYLNPSVDSSGKRTMGSIRTIKNMMIEVLESSRGKIPAWCTPQAFTYGFIDRFADYPTFDEFNCMLFTAVANGCKGFTPFVYNDHFNSVDLRLGADFIYETFEDLDDILISPEKPYKTTVSSPDVDVWIKEHRGEVFVIAVNMTDKEMEADINCEQMKRVRRLYGYREKTSVDVKDGKFTLGFYPYQVHLLSYPAKGKGLKTVEALKKEIEETKNGFAEKGNILYGKRKEIEWVGSDPYISNAGLYTLTNGITDSYGWVSWTRPTSEKTPSFVEAKFLTFVPRFKNLKVYSSTIEDMQVYIWKAGDWKKVGEVKENKNKVIEFEWAETLSTVKMKILITKVHPGTKAEIYEIEAYQ